MYVYEELKAGIFTESGQEMFLKIRDNTKELIKESGAVTMGSAISGVSGDSWLMIACVDRMVELGEIREIKQGEVPGQFRVFVST